MNSQASDSDSLNEPKRQKFRIFRVLSTSALVLLFGVLVAGWIFQKQVFNVLVPMVLDVALAGSDFQLLRVETEVRIGSPVVLRNLRLGPSERVPEGSLTRLEIGLLEVAPGKLVDLLFTRERLIARLTAGDVRVVLDARQEFLPEPLPMPELSQPQQEEVRAWVLRLLPLHIALEGGAFILLGDGFDVELRGVGAEFSNRSEGIMRVRYGQFRTEGGWQKGWEELEAKTAWKGGEMVVFDAEVFPGVGLRDLRLDLARLGGPGVSLEADLFGGWARMDLGSKVKNKKPEFDLQAWAGGLQVSEALHFFLPDQSAGGVIEQFRFGFRGNPDDVVNASMTLRTEIRDFSWQGKGWEELAVGVASQNGIFELSEFQLRQKENRVAASGKAEWPKDGQWEKTAFEISVDANVAALSEVAALAGAAYGDLNGIVRVKGRLSGGDGLLEGEMEASAENLSWKDQQLGTLRSGLSLAGSEIDVREFAWKNGKDFASFEGRLSTRDPNLYSGKLSLEIAEIAGYEPLLRGFGMEGEKPSGGLQVHWQGDGTRVSHSGGFEISVSELKTESFPLGLEGSFHGTYSPDNIYLREGVLRQKDLELRWVLSAGKEGVYASGIRLLSGRNGEMLNGEIYLPWNPLVLLNGGDWQKGVISGRNLYADLRSKPLRAKGLMELLGQTSPVDAGFSLAVRAGGELMAPVLDADLRVENIRLEQEPATVLAEEAVLNFSSQDGSGVLNANIVISGVDPVRAELKFPFGFRIEEDGFHIEDFAGSLEGVVRLPRIDLAKFQSLIPARTITGVVDGEIVLGNSLLAPSINGVVRVSNGALDWNRQVPSLTDFQLVCRFDGESFRLEDTRGRIGAGPFDITGGGSFKDPTNVSAEIRVVGKDVLLMRNRQIRLRANLDLLLSGSARDGGGIKGSVELVDGRFFQQLEITPLLQGAANDATAPPVLPDLSGLVPPPWAAWKLDVGIRNATPFLVAGNIASGEIVPDLRIIGTLGDPRPTGMVTMRDVRAFLPFSVVTIREGTIRLREDVPRIPVLDIRGESQVLEYDIMILAQGPLDNQTLILRSDPPLPEESIILLLTAGLEPGSASGAGLGEAAIGQGGLLLLKAFARSFERDGVDLDSLINRLQVTSAPPLATGLRPTLRAQFRLNDGWSVMSERDAQGFLGGGVTYTIRFR